MFRFAHPDYLYLLLLVPILMVLFYYALFLRTKRLDRLGNKALVLGLMPDVSHWRPRVKFYLSILALVLTVFVVAGPQFGTKQETVKRKGIELMIAVDVSNSMLAQDVAPNRMDRAKQILSRLIDKLEDDKVGLLVFAGDTYVQMPMTTDVASAKMFLSGINPGMVPIQGTSISSAIKMAMNLFGKEDGISRSIIIITDGENHEGDAAALAKQALEKGISVNVLGLGTAQGSPIPIKGTTGFRKDADGNIVVTKLNEAMCQEIASAGGGLYVRADNIRGAVSYLSKELNKISKSEIESKVFSNYKEQYEAIAWILLLLLIAELCLIEKKNPYFKHVKLF